MDPKGFAAALKRQQVALAGLPAAVESPLLAAATKGVPAGVSVRVSRSNSGVVVSYSGRGARRAAAAGRERVAAAGADVVRSAGRGVL